MSVTHGACKVMGAPLPNGERTLIQSREVSMRKLLWTAAILTLCSAPAAAQQIEKSPFAAAQEIAAEVQASSTEAPSLLTTPEQIDATIRALAEERAQGRQQIGSNFWYMVAAIALGIIVASLLLD